MSTFQFKHFSVSQADTTMKVGTDAMLLGSLVSYENQPKNILDIGAGTGVIALMLAQRFENAEIAGIEIDEGACKGAKVNFENSTWANRLSLLNDDILESYFEVKFDLIVSNPPYYENSLLSENKRTSRAKHAEFLPVDLFLNKIQDILSENGSFWVIVPSDNTESWIENSKGNNLHLSKNISIIGKEGQGEKRNILAFSRTKVAVETSKLTVRDSSNNYTKEYIKLTSDFHDRDLSK